MSYTRLPYDVCAYSSSLNQSVAPLSYLLDPIKYQHCQKCRMEHGVLGGTIVSHVAEDHLINLENDLRGQTRPVTRCPQYKYLPGGPSVVPPSVEYIKPVVHPHIDGQLHHLRGCQMFGTLETPMEPVYSKFSCAAAVP
jgi:hypothetical protein